MEEIDIWRTAKLLIDSHGDGAWLQAAQRADKALEDGKPEIAGVWKRVLQAVERLQDTTPHGTIH